MAALRFATDIPDIAWTNRALPSTSLDPPSPCQMMAKLEVSPESPPPRGRGSSADRSRR